MLSLFFERCEDDCLIINNRLELVLAEQICGFLHHQVKMIDEGFYLTSVAQKASVEKQLTRAHDPDFCFVSLIVGSFVNQQSGNAKEIHRFITWCRTD